ncbi:APC family permease [Paenibacillus beijingensis]|uniref:Putrescine importer PuuP n=1 Tax=Paenibacillus beijingensis TaxID=1126833 RepID=A0A0D5NP89_9BACL|nr:APC family permease [Paenibacillus beijingensis]AJY76985.1 Putrescine importer PuuP [Paenibacillus beijingensis]
MKSNVKLTKSLRLSDIVFIGLAWMTPMVYFTVFGISFETSGGMITQAYLLAFVAIFFTACNYGIMSRTFPTSGSAYTYVAKSMHPNLGFVVGWAVLLDYFFSPLIASLSFGIYLNAQFPSVPVYIWITLLNVAITVINIMGIKISANISKIFVWIQILFILLFSAFLIRNLNGGMNVFQPFQTDAPFSAVLAGSALICFCFLGFDAITTMSEEAIDAKRTIPKAVIVMISIALIVYFIPSYLTQLVFPNVTFSNADTAGFEIVKMAGGAFLSAVFITVLILATFTQGLTSLTSVSRLLYVMGRDSVLPKRFFGYLHPKYKTPVINIAIGAIFSMLAIVISLESAVKFVSFGALTAFTFVNLSVIFQKFIKEKKRSPRQTVLYLIFPLIGAAFIGWLLTLLDLDALMMGGIWLVFGIGYYLIRKKRIGAGEEHSAIAEENSPIPNPVEL